jgi:hypothetical protein
MTNSYNSTIHTTTGLPPNRVDSSNEDIVFRRLYESIILAKKQKPKFKLGAKVYIARQKALFTKGYLPSIGDEVFVIRKVQNTVPESYLIRDLNGEDVQGAFYTFELSEVV